MDPYKADYIIHLMMGVLFICVGLGVGLAGWLNRSREGLLPWYTWRKRLAASLWILPVCYGALFVVLGISVALFMLLGPKKVGYIIPLMIGGPLICVGVGVGER